MEVRLYKMKKLSFIFGVLITSVGFANQNIAISKMSRSNTQTQFIVKQIGGMIKYDDGQIIENEDAYVVWTYDKAEFAGLNDDGTVLDPSNSVVLCKFTIKNGKFKPFSGSYGYMIGNYKSGNVQVVMMDSRTYPTNNTETVESDITNVVDNATNIVDTVTNGVDSVTNIIDTVTNTIVDIDKPIDIPETNVVDKTENTNVVIDVDKPIYSGGNKGSSIDIPETNIVDNITNEIDVVETNLVDVVTNKLDNVTNVVDSVTNIIDTVTNNVETVTNMIDTVTNIEETVTNKVETTEETDKTEDTNKNVEPVIPNPTVDPTENDKDNVDKIIETIDPTKELEIVDLNEVYKKSRIKYAIIYDKKRKFGYGTLKIGKRNRKTGKVRLDLQCYFFDGKNTKSSIYVIPDEYGMIDGEFGLPEAYGDYLRFSMFYDQDINDFIFSGNNDFYKVETFDNMGGVYTEPTEFTFSVDLNECPALEEYNIVIDALPLNEYVLIKNKTRFYTNKSANIKYKKSNGKYYIDGLNDPKRTNLSGLRIINYNSKNGYFKGYFYLYIEQMSSNKQVLKKYKVTLNGILVEGEASGFGKVKIDGNQYFIPFEMK